MPLHNVIMPVIAQRHFPISAKTPDKKKSPVLQVLKKPNKIILIPDMTPFDHSQTQGSDKGGKPLNKGI